MEFESKIGLGSIINIVMMMGGLIGAYTAFKTWQVTITAQIGDQQKINATIVSEQKEITKMVQEIKTDQAVMKEQIKGVLK